VFVFHPNQQPLGHSRQIQGMDKKFDGHVWNKVKMTNIKNSFNLVLSLFNVLGI